MSVFILVENTIDDDYKNVSFCVSVVGVFSTRKRAEDGKINAMKNSIKEYVKDEIYDEEELEGILKNKGITKKKYSKIIEGEIVKGENFRLVDNISKKELCSFYNKLFVGEYVDRTRNLSICEKIVDENI